MLNLDSELAMSFTLVQSYLQFAYKFALNLVIYVVDFTKFAAMRALLNEQQTGNIRYQF